MPRPICTRRWRRVASSFAQTLRLALIDVAPESVEDPTIVVLSPGIHSETSFDQAYLASVLGFPLVESADLVVRDGKLWMRSLGTLRRVDVVLRRVDADYSDPLDLRADSQLGVVGLVEVLRRGAVTVVNSLGSGVLENPGLARFLPDLSRRLLDEPLALSGGQSWWGGIDTERSHLLANLASLLVKSTAGRRSTPGHWSPHRRWKRCGHVSKRNPGAGSVKNSPNCPWLPPTCARARSLPRPSACGCSQWRSGVATRR